MQHVFISYSRLDSNIVGLIESDLKDNGHQIWRDVENIQGGEEWSDAIEQGILSSYVFIVLVSSNSLASTWVNREIKFATNHPNEIPIVPIILEQVQIPVSLQKWQIVDFSEVQAAQGLPQISAYRQSIQRLLRDLEELRPVLRYIKELQASNEDVRENAARILGKLADPIAIAALIDALSDRDEDVVFEATIALGNLKSKSAYKGLVRLLDSDDHDLCAAAAYALGKIGIPHALGPLLQLLKHQDRFVRECAAQSLGQLNELGAIEPLICLMRNDSISDVRAAATKALKSIGGPMAEQAIRRREAMEAFHTYG